MKKKDIAAKVLDLEHRLDRINFASNCQSKEEIDKVDKALSGGLEPALYGLLNQLNGLSSQIIELRSRSKSMEGELLQLREDLSRLNPTDHRIYTRMIVDPSDPNEYYPGWRRGECNDLEP